jgi:hypothetical protein
MRRFLVVSAAGLLALLLGACTGTFEARNPILLVTGYQNGG